MKNRNMSLLVWLTAIILTFNLASSAGNEWPSGKYGLPKPRSGCPRTKESVWHEGWRYQDMEDAKKNINSRSSVSSGIHMEIKLIGYKMDIKRSFCMKQNTDQQPPSWPKGSYCIYKSKDVACPKDMTSEWVRWDDEDYKNRNSRGGKLPDGSYDSDTLIRYCCQAQGHWFDSVELPVNKPFYLLTCSLFNTPKCQIVNWAFSYLEYIVFDTDDQSNNDSQNGSHVFTDTSRSTLTTYYCYYRDCRQTFSNLTGSFTSHKEAISDFDPHFQYCSWLITIPEEYVVSLRFKFVVIPKCIDTFFKIYDGPSENAQLLGKYCGLNASEEVEVLSSTNNLFIVSNSGSYATSPKSTFDFRAHYIAKNKIDRVTSDATRKPNRNHARTTQSGEVIETDANEEWGKEKIYLTGLIVMTILLVIVLLFVAYLVHRIRSLKMRLCVEVPHSNKESRNVGEKDEGYEIPLHTTPTSDVIENKEMGSNDAIYTSLNRRGNPDEEHLYTHLYRGKQNE